MANPDHIKLLTQGVEEIEKWILADPKIILESLEGDLTDFDLDGATCRAQI